MRPCGWFTFVVFLTCVSQLHCKVSTHNYKNSFDRGLFRWLPLYAWGKLRYDPWVLRHPGIWLYGVPPNKVKVVEIKRSKSKSKWSMFLRRSRLLNAIADRPEKEILVRSQRKKLLDVLDRFNTAVPQYQTPNKGDNIATGDNFEAYKIKDKATEPFIDDSLANAHLLQSGFSMDDASGEHDHLFNPMLYDKSREGMGIPNDNSFGNFGDIIDDDVDESLESSTVACETKDAMECSSESDCACDGAYLCVDRTCSTQADDNPPSFFDKLSFVKRSAPSTPQEHVADKTEQIK